MPDPLAARSVIEVLKNMFNLNIDLVGIHEEVSKADKMVVRLQKIEENRVIQAEETRKEEDKQQPTSPEDLCRQSECLPNFLREL